MTDPHRDWFTNEPPLLEPGATAIPALSADDPTPEPDAPQAVPLRAWVPYAASFFVGLLAAMALALTLVLVLP